MEAGKVPLNEAGLASEPLFLKLDSYPLRPDKNYQEKTTFSKRRKPDALIKNTGFKHCTFASLWSHICCISIHIKAYFYIQ